MLSKRSIKANRRFAQNSNAATKLLLFEYNGQPAETKRVNLDKFTRKTKTEDRDKVELASRRVFDVLNRMSGIFLPKDPLLKSSGMLPVLYWFIRNASPTSDQHIREFLNGFEIERKNNRNLAQNSSNKRDDELVTFDRYNRSTDDPKSHIARYEILSKKFARYLKNKK